VDEPRKSAIIAVCASILAARKLATVPRNSPATTGIFERIPRLRRLPCAYVPFECKNYTIEVENPELDQLAGRFSVNRGKLGFLCCRTFQNRARFIERCRDTFNDDRGLIIPLDDAAVIRMLTLVHDGQRNAIDDLLSELVAEVWVG